MEDTDLELGTGRWDFDPLARAPRAFHRGVHLVGAIRRGHDDQVVVIDPCEM
jgi:hypothetical protein